MNLDDRDKHDLPLLRHPSDAESVFTPQALIEAVRAERGMTSVTVPEVCDLEFDGDLTDRLAQSNAVEPWNTWACFHTPMFALEVNGICAYLHSGSVLTMPVNMIIATPRKTLPPEATQRWGETRLVRQLCLSTGTMSIRIS